MPESSIERVYRERAAGFSTAASAEQIQIRLLSNARFIVFVVAIIAAWLLRSTPAALAMSETLTDS